MSTLQATQTATDEPRPRVWSREEYYRLGELGWFQDQRVELIDGEIVQMSPQKNLHGVVITAAYEALRRAFGEGYWVRPQLPLRFDRSSRPSEPEPDVSVVSGDVRSYAGADQDHPSSALLVVEVSDATLRFDQNDKAGLYAANGIADYWVVNLPQRRVEVYREPVADAEHRFGWRYRSVAHLDRSQRIAPLAAPGSEIAVSDLLP